MRDNYITAAAHGDSEKNMFRRVSSMYTREPDTDHGLGEFYIVDLIGDGGAMLVSIVCENHNIPMFRMSIGENRPVRDIVNYFLDATPPRCAIVLDICDNELASKVRARIRRKRCDLRFKRVVFCLSDHETGSTNSIQVPGSIDDKIQMLLYHVPDHIQKEPGFSLDCLCPLADAMKDYALFQPRVWQQVNIKDTLHEFLSTAMYQVVRRVCTDPCVDNGFYPSFEQNWRRDIAPRLRRTLAVAPDALCPSIHRVIPIGVLPKDAMQAMTVAIPKDIQDPYSITVQSSAVDDHCGSIAITQPMRYTVVNVICMINPGILVDVCRELRTGHRALAGEVHSINQKLSKMENKQEDTSTQLKEMASMLKRLSNDVNGKSTPVNNNESGKCAKTGCRRTVTKRFRSGKLHRQCSSCVSNS